MQLLTKKKKLKKVLKVLKVEKQKLQQQNNLNFQYSINTRRQRMLTAVFFYPNFVADLKRR
jgi:hypothetical protein